MSSPIAKRADYGLDAPGVIRNLALVGILCLVLGWVLNRLFQESSPTLATILFWLAILNGLFFLGTAVLMVLSSKWGKFRERETLFDILHLNGNEQILDIGCGRGLLLNGIARRLKNGKAVGIDLWHNEDQSHNSPDATRANAHAEGVADRIEVKTADMRD